ncbi:MAG: transcription-repair coupling factor [Bacteroidetes bacterium]|jgi:transcription-repair coupling factor (superfamily II helicase)|nr:transcription-repair coupling factor [Bacteroidota bacterium]
MNLQYLQDLYLQHACLKPLTDEIVLPSPKLIQLTNIHASAFSFIASSVFKQIDYNHLFILDDKESAAYFQNDFETLTGALDICLFPDSYKKTGQIGELNSSHVMLRAEALMKLNTKNPHKKVLVTYPEALVEKVVNTESFSKNTIYIKQSEKLDVSFLTEFMVTMGFTKVDFVYEPGQFAIRGGIIDIYSFGNEHPYRVELFDDEVDTIRIFNPETQLSERKLLQVTIIPNIETHFDTQEKVTLFEFLPANTIVWMHDAELVVERIGKLLSHLEQKGNIVIHDTNDHEVTLTVDDFSTMIQFVHMIQQRTVVEFGKGFAAEVFSMNLRRNFPFQTKDQPSFNRNFEMLIQDLQDKAAEHFNIFIFSENPKQLERLRTIFQELNANILFTPIPHSISQGFIDKDTKVVCYTDHQIFQRYHKYKMKQAYSQGKALSLRALKDLQAGDFVAHIDHGVGRYSGLQKIDVNGVMQEAVRIIYKDNDVLYVNINSLHKITKYTGKEGTVPKIHKIGSGVWEKLKSKTKKQIKDIAGDLIKLYAQRKASKGFAHSPDSYLQTELEISFMYEDTPDQSTATADVKKDMESDSPMDRLVCGDVGFGKTEVAIRAAFKSVVDSKQAAILVPTTILAYQHFQNFKERLKDFPCTVDYLNRFKSSKEKKDTLLRLKEGKIDIIIGTHALLSKDVEFKDLGILIIDEEQKFGVASKEKIRSFKANVDTLTLTATPIPRTLQFSLMGARDLSVINTPPPNRQPVHTELAMFNDELIRDAIYYETERAGQVFFIHNRVQGLAEMKAHIQALCPDISIGMAHGQLEGDELEEAILDFMAQKYDVLVCTNIVESGVDIPNANTIIINNAHNFGLSDLHQLRGRVGRSNKKAFCYLLAPSLALLPSDSKKRLQTIEQYSELGSGFSISMRDLDIRGAGNMLGGEQSGFITDIGFEMYQKILNEAIRELKHHEFKEVFKDQILDKEDFVSDCTVDTDLEILIPDSYVESIAERLSLYTQLDNCENEASLLRFESSLIDRFGPIPKPVKSLLVALRARWTAQDLGFERLILKNKQLRLYFVSNPDSPYFESDTFKHILKVIQLQIKNARLKNVGTNFMLIVDQVKSIEEVLGMLERMKRVEVKEEQVQQSEIG